MCASSPACDRRSFLLPPALRAQCLACRQRLHLFGSLWAWRLCLVLASLATLAGAAETLRENSIPLAGTWRFWLDAHNTGVEKKWFTEKLEDSVTLPGTTDTNQKGEFKDGRAVDRLSRVWYWKGPAWYQREVVIPDSWRGIQYEWRSYRGPKRTFVCEREIPGADSEQSVVLALSDFAATAPENDPLKSWSEIDQFGICAHFAERGATATQVPAWIGPAPPFTRLEWM